MIRYLTLEEVVELHRLALEQSGGLDGVRDFGGQELTPTLPEKAAALGFQMGRQK